MPGPDVSSAVVFAYMGLGSGLEFLPYFAALVSLAGAALIAVVQQPVWMVIRRLRGRRQNAPAEGAVGTTQPPSEAAPPSEPGNDAR